MADDLWNEPPVPVERPVTLPPLGSVLPRLFTLVVGTVLIAVGCYYAISVVMTGLRVARDPGGIEASLIATSRMLELDGVTVTLNDARVPVGRLVAGCFLIPWYLISAILALKLVQLGGRLVLGELAERRESLATMRVLLSTLRAEIERARSRKSS